MVLGVNRLKGLDTAMKWNEIDTIPCSVARTLSVIGDRWTMLILRDAFRHPVRFERLNEKFGMTRHLLANRLDRLVEQGILDRRAYQERPVRHEYALTDKGKSLFPVMIAMMEWGDAWMSGNDGPPVLLRHTTCGATFPAAPVCPSCGIVLSADTTSSEMRATDSANTSDLSSVARYRG